MESLEFDSEQLEPTASYCLGRWYHNCEAVKDNPIALERACQTLWFGIRALNRLSILCNGATHFSVACSNEMRRVNDYIAEVLKIEDFKDEPLFSKDMLWSF